MVHRILFVADPKRRSKYIINDDESIYLYFTIENFYYVIYDRNEMESLCIRSNTTN